jgi:hypothetical protein
VKIKEVFVQTVMVFLVIGKYYVKNIILTIKTGTTNVVVFVDHNIGVVVVKP